MPVTETKTGAWYGLATYGTQLYSTASNTLAVNESVVGTSAVGSVTVVEGVGVTFAVPSVSATTTVDTTGLNVYMAFTTPSVSATLSINASQNDLYNGFRVNTNFKNAYYGEGVYGASFYGNISGPTEVLLSSVVGTGSVTTATISGDSDTGALDSVAVDIITDSLLIDGDEVTVTADAVVVLPGVEGTSVLNDVTQRSNNTIPVTGSQATGSVNTVTTVAKASVALASAEGTGVIGDSVTLQSRYTIESVSATGAVTTAVPGENARPTFSGVSGVMSPGNVTTSTTTVIFDVANKDHQRTASVEPDKPRIVYVRAA